MRRRRRRGEFAAAPDVTETFGPHAESELDDLARDPAAAPARLAEAAVDAFGQRAFGVVWITFAAPHLAGHRLWHRSEALAAVYEATDAALGRVIAALPADADVIACSVLGMGPDSSRADLLPGMLGAVLGGGARSGNGDSDAGSIWRLRGAMPASLRRRAAAAMPDRAALALTARLELRGVDWETVTAFAHPADNQGYVRLNLRGREAAGTVEPERAKALCEEISAGLGTFLDPDGEPAVLSVDRCAGTEGAAPLRACLTSWSAGVPVRTRAPWSRPRSARSPAAERAVAAAATTPTAMPGRSWPPARHMRGRRRDRRR